jgi:hypothetical protein
MNWVDILLVAIPVLAVLPGVIGLARRHAHPFLLFFLSAFFSGTIIGWVLLMWWALKGETRAQYLLRQPPVAHKGKGGRSGFSTALILHWSGMTKSLGEAFFISDLFD